MNKTKIEIHPLFDFMGIDDCVVKEIKAGRRLIVNSGFKRGLKHYNKGDTVILGEKLRDDFLCRPHPLSGEPWVMTEKQYTDQSYDEVVSDSIILLERAMKDAQAREINSKIRESVLQNQLKAAKVYVRTAVRETRQAKKMLDTARDEFGD